MITKNYWYDHDNNNIMPEILPLTMTEMLTSSDIGLVLSRSNGEASCNKDGKNPFRWQVIRRNYEPDATVAVFFDDELMTGESSDFKTPEALREYAETWPTDCHPHQQIDLGEMLHPRPTWNNPKEVGMQMLLNMMKATNR